jgi:hypothetical protein
MDNFECFAHRNMVRILGCLALPYIFIGIGIFVLLSKGHSLYDYWYLVKIGEIKISSQIFGFIGLLLWFYYIYPNAIKFLMQRKCVIYISKGLLYSYGVNICPIDSLKDISVDESFLRKDLVVVCGRGRINCGSVVLCREAPDSIVSKLKLRCQVQ